MNGEVDREKLQAEITYYRNRLDELAGENLRFDYQISGLKKEVRQRRQAFTLLSELQQTIRAEKEVSNIFTTAVAAVNATLGMDRTVVLLPVEENRFRPGYWTGGKVDERFTQAVVTFPGEMSTAAGVILVDKKTESSPLIEELRGTLGLPHFVGVPVLVEGAPIGLLFSGRLKEAGSLFPPLDRGDVETLQAVAALVSAVVENMRVAVLQEMDRLKTNFFANISHELRTPITLTLGPLEGMLKRRYGEVPVAIAGQARVMLASQERLLGLVNQILDLAKMEGGGAQLRASRLPDVNEFIEQRVAQFRPLAERRGIELRTSFDPELVTAEVYADREKLDKLLFNLLSNAHKFTTRGFVEVSSARAGDELRVQVRDSGVGIRADQLPHVFDRFRQADGSASREFAGTGIGLSLVREVATLHGGTVTVQSEYGVGTTFTVAVPFGKAHLDAQSLVEYVDEELPAWATSRVVDVHEGAVDDNADEVNAEATAAFDPDKATVLYVDDNRDLRAYVRDLLVASYNVFLAVNGVDGLDKARERRPDLILSDVMMPKMTGTEFCQRVRGDEQLRAIPFVLLTAKSSGESRIEGLNEGADDYLSKPFSEPELLARIKNLIQLRRHQVRAKRELDAARVIQQALLPRQRQRVGRVELEALYHPCEELSGDFYDVVARGSDLYAYVADVTSHGTAAAQVTYLLKGLFANAVEGSEPPPLAHVAGELARRYAAFGLTYDVAIQLVHFDGRTGTFEYLRGGAPAAIVVKGDAWSTVLTPPTQPLTARADPGNGEIPVVRAALCPGECLYLFTDGAYEFSAGRRDFGTRRLGQLLASVGTAWTDRVLAALMDARGGARFEDDLTVLRFTMD